jgi:hypothetical protein
MIWLTLRQFRVQTTITLAVLAAATIYAVATGLPMHHDYSAGLAVCPDLRGCSDFDWSSFPRIYNVQQQVLQVLVIAAPALIGIFWGAPLVAGEFERGSHRMLFNQSVTPARWLAVKLTVLGLAAMLTAEALSLLLTWWASPLDLIADNRFSVLDFATRGITPLGYAAFAFALGTGLGLFFRRTVPAIAVTMVVFLAMELVFAAALRPNLLPSTTETVPVNATTLSQLQIGQTGGPNQPIAVYGAEKAGAWTLSVTDVENSSGQEISANQVSSCFNVSSGPVGGCLAPYNLHFDYTYQPAGNYWPLQGVETGIYLTLAALLGGACLWRIRRHRD